MSQIFVAFSEYLNFNLNIKSTPYKQKNPIFLCVVSFFENQKNWWDSRLEKVSAKPSQFRQMQMALNLKLGVIHKLRWQEEVGRLSKNVEFLSP
jgi:hypothetical protein